MKTAVCLFGFLRSFKDREESFYNNIIKDTNADIYIYTPNTYYPQSSIDNFYDSGKESPENVNINDFKFIKNNIKEFIIYEYDSQIFKNKVKEYSMPETYQLNDFECLVEFNPKLQEELRRWGMHYESWRSFSMMYHIQKSLELKIKYEQENNFKYDVVILTRPDLEYISNIRNLNSIKEKFIYHPINTKHISHLASVFVNNLTHLCFCDHIMLGTSSTIDSLKNVYDEIGNYYANEKILPNNETLLGYYCYLNVIPNKYDDFIDYKIIH